MQEKRRSKRIKAHLELNVSSVFKQDNVKVENIESPITVINVSRHGIGFVSKSVLPDGYYFNAALQLGDKDNVLYCVVKIIRCIPTDNGEYRYGCEYVGLPSIFSYIFEEFEDANVGNED